VPIPIQRKHPSIPAPAAAAPCLSSRGSNAAQPRITDRARRSQPSGSTRHEQVRRSSSRNAVLLSATRLDVPSAHRNAVPVLQIGVSCSLGRYQTDHRNAFIGAASRPPITLPLPCGANDVARLLLKSPVRHGPDRATRGFVPCRFSDAGPRAGGPICVGPASENLHKRESVPFGLMSASTRSGQAVA